MKGIDTYLCTLFRVRSGKLSQALREMLVLFDKEKGLLLPMIEKAFKFYLVSAVLNLKRLLQGRSREKAPFLRFKAAYYF